MVNRQYLLWATLFLSEVIASMILLFLGCMSEVDKSGFFTPSIVTIAMSFGIAIMIAINAMGVVSGGHCTPIITLTTYIYKMLDLPTALVYVLGQLVGSFLGYALVRAAIPDEYLSHPDTFCISRPNLSIGRAFIVEFTVSFILITFLCAVFHPKNANHHDSVSIKFGMFIVGMVLVAGPYSGTSMNPARSFAPALYNWNWDKHWLYWVAPFSGSFVATMLFKYVLAVDYSDVQAKKEIKNSEHAEEIKHNI